MAIRDLDKALEEVRISLDCPLILVLGRSLVRKIPQFGIFPLILDDVVIEKTIKRLKQKIGFSERLHAPNIFGASLYKTVTPDTRRELIPVVQSALLEMEEELVLVFLRDVKACAVFNLAIDHFPECPCISFCWKLKGR